jgi:hypothetical protein
LQPVNFCFFIKTTLFWFKKTDPVKTQNPDLGSGRV